jgi:lipoprotein-anchoring transpeptidase ErfK/SrfK
MRRSMSVSSGTWQALVDAKPLRARYRRSGTHLEVDKSKQIMMVVRDGEVLGALHVSTGATGNTPVGRFKVYQKGGSYLYKFMAFYGNFGTHGYPSVPANPASHGCVRQPNWIASWTFSKVKIGDSFYVYR